MRGQSSQQSSMLCLMSPESRVPPDHPLRAIKALADKALKRLSRTFARMYSKTGRPSIPPETLLKSMVLMALYSVRSERLFCEMLDYNLLYRWFLDMDMMEESFHHSGFCHNRDRLLQHEVARKFLRETFRLAEADGLTSHEHFSVDGTLIEAWASMKSFRPKDDDDGDSNGWSDFRGGKRSNDTHESKTDPEAMLRRKGRGKEAKLCFSGHVLMENRNGLVADLEVSRATGTAEREAALDMLDRTTDDNRRMTLGADAGYNTRDFVEFCRQRKVTPHVAHKKHSAVDARTTRHGGYKASQRVRKRIESIFGWAKTIGGLRKTRYRGVSPNQHAASLQAAAYNLLRLATLAGSPA
jgi:transposase